MTRPRPASEPLELDVETFPADHPAIRGQMLTEYARAALGAHGGSPCSLNAHCRDSIRPALISFRPPDPRSHDTVQRPVIVEFGAVVIGGQLIRATEGLQITRVARRGDRIDYFLGQQRGDEGTLLEVSGTDKGSLDDLGHRKQRQLLESFYARPPFSRPGFVSVTRFADPAASRLIAVPAIEATKLS